MRFVKFTEYHEHHHIWVAAEAIATVQPYNEGAGLRVQGGLNGSWVTVTEPPGRVLELIEAALRASPVR